MSASARREALEDLLYLRVPVAVAIESLRVFPWDSEIALATMTRGDALRLLDAFQAGSLTARECEAWANAVEGRDDVGYEEAAEELLKGLLFELASPEVSRELTLETAKEWRQRLAAQPPSDRLSDSSS